MPADAAASSPSVAELQRRNERLEAELRARAADCDEAQAREAALAEVLSIISRSPGDPQPVFEVILAKAMTLCDAAFGIFNSFDGQSFKTVAARGVPEAYLQFRLSNPPDYGPETGPGRLIAGENSFHVVDMSDTDAYRAGDPNRRAIVDLGGARTNLVVALRKDNKLLGMMAIYRKEVRPFFHKQIALVQTFADQAVIAMENARLLGELRQRTDELTESLKYQTATSDVLKVISRSTFVLQKVLDTLVESAVVLCEADIGTIRRRKGEAYMLAATFGFTPEARSRAEGYSPLPSRSSIFGQAVLEDRTIHIPDVLADPDYARPDLQRLTGFRASLGVLLRREGNLIGTLVLQRFAPGPFSPRQIELVETFADQAVIAMENARLLTEQREALDRQTATAEVLKVINSSPGHLAPVFDAMLDKAIELCGAKFGTLFLRDGQAFTVAANRNVPPAFAKAVLGRAFTVESNTVLRYLLEHKSALNVTDTFDEVYRTRDPLRVASIELGGVRSLVAVPLLKDANVVGCIAIYREQPGGFEEGQLALVSAFADQAVIAMENARLLTEQREALERQTATAEVLEVINASPGMLEPVFQTMIEKAVQLCSASYGYIWSYDGQNVRPVATHGDERFGQWLRQELGPVAPGPNSPLGRAVHGKRLIQIVDATQEETYRVEPRFRGLVDQAGLRTLLHLPLCKEDRVLGVITVYRRERLAFTDQQIRLLQNFGEQAVIAMENARLLTEQREALEQQTAMAEVLKVISESPTDVQPALDAVAKAARRFCGALDASITLVDGEELVVVAHDGLIAGGGRDRFDRTTSRGLSIATATTVHIPDLESAEGEQFELARRIGRRFNFRAVISTPLMRDGLAIGCLTLRRPDPGAFTPHQIQLLETFAAQAVIAIENVRLFTELSESLDQQTATTEVLETINASPGDLQPVFDAIVDKAMALCDSAFGMFNTFDGERFHTVATRGIPEVYAEFRRANPPDYSPVTGPGRLVAGEDVINVEDTKDSEHYRRGDPNRRALVDLGGARSILNVALRRERQLLGMIAIYRQEVRPFSDKQVALVKAFADQAVIAMENARLLGELRESLEQQTATADILRVISQSPTDVAPVLQAIVKAAVRFCGAQDALVHLRDGDERVSVAQEGPVGTVLNRRFPLDRDSILARAILDGKTIELPDIDRLDPTEYATTAQVARDLSFRSILAAPMLRDGTAIGAIALRRFKPGPFTPRQIELLENFAAQAVIALENTRLFTELRQRTNDLTESLDYQVATSEVLEAIGRSTSDIQPVLDTMLRAAQRLCRTESGGIAIQQGDAFRYVATMGWDLATEKAVRARRIVPARGMIGDRTLLERGIVEIPDIATDPDFPLPEIAGGWHTSLGVPLLRDGEPIGVITLTRRKIEPFTERQIALVKTFADQAVIAMENTRLLRELRQRTDDLTESLEYQTATSRLLEVISRSASDIHPVFDAMLTAAARLCDTAFGSVNVMRGDVFRNVANLGYSAEVDNVLRELVITPGRGTITGRTLLAGQVIHIHDLSAEPEFSVPAIVEVDRLRTALGVPLIRDGTTVGVIVLCRNRVEPFTERQIALVRTFADQAVIAMENARLLGELRDRQAELRVTFDNMGDGVVMFDADLNLAAWNRNFQELLDVPDDFLASRPGLGDYVRLLVQRGELGDRNPDKEVARYTERATRQWSTERTRPDGRVLEVRNNPVPGGGAVLIYSDITRRKKAEADIRAARDAAEVALDTLKAAQANLVQSEKMASLGQLTAGIAHEIKNPLNFVNNFAGLSRELVLELKETVDAVLTEPDESKRADLQDTMDLLTGNLAKIVEHGQRADGIVKSMLAHSRGGTGDWQSSNINNLVEEALNLAYHGARAQDKEFNVTLQRDFDQSPQPIDVVPQDVTRVFLNLFGNGFYATRKRQLEASDSAYRPMVRISTREVGEAIEVRVRDNGTGIAADVREKLFQPFFTTKPTGEGTGLGLSISYDIVTQQHGGSIAVESEVGQYTEFTVRLPRARRAAAASSGGE
jgi:GAF domain-containing protein/nitrogen-specific signal transduction histidine kinase